MTPYKLISKVQRVWSGCWWVGVLTDFTARVTWAVYGHFDGFLVQGYLWRVCPYRDCQSKTFS